MDRRSFIAGALAVPAASVLPVSQSILLSPAQQEVVLEFVRSGGFWLPVAEMGSNGTWREIVTGNEIHDHGAYMDAVRYSITAARAA